MPCALLQHFAVQAIPICQCMQGRYSAQALVWTSALLMRLLVSKHPPAWCHYVTLPAVSDRLPSQLLALTVQSQTCAVLKHVGDVAVSNHLFSVTAITTCNLISRLGTESLAARPLRPNFILSGQKRYSLAAIARQIYNSFALHLNGICAPACSI